MAPPWQLIPGVPAAGHVTAGGWWHPGRADGCPKCPTPECECGHADTRHLGLTGRCLAAGRDGELWADDCQRYRRKQ